MIIPHESWEIKKWWQNFTVGPSTIFILFFFANTARTSKDMTALIYEQIEQWNKFIVESTLNNCQKKTFGGKFDSQIVLTRKLNLKYRVRTESPCHGNITVFHV